MHPQSDQFYLCMSNRSFSLSDQPQTHKETLPLVKPLCFSTCARYLPSFAAGDFTSPTLPSRKGVPVIKTTSYAFLLLIAFHLAAFRVYATCNKHLPPSPQFMRLGLDLDLNKLPPSAQVVPDEYTESAWARENSFPGMA